MPASILSIESPPSRPLAGRLHPDTPFGQRYQAVIDGILETAPIRLPSLPLAEPRPLGALSLDELAAVAGRAVLSAAELASQHITLEDYRGALREQALAVHVTRYAEQTRAFLGVPADIAFAFNDTAAAAIAAMMARQGCYPPENAILRPSPDERAEITLLSPTCETLARISFDLRGAATMDDVQAWLERTLAGDRLFDLGISRLKNSEENIEMARRVLSRLWDALVAA